MPRYDATTRRGSKTSGLGCTIEVTSHSNEKLTRISGLAEALKALKIPSKELQDSEFLEGTLPPQKDDKVLSPRSPRAGVILVDKGQGYVQVCLPSRLMSRYEVRDRMTGLGWVLQGFSTCSHEGALVTSEIWAIPQMS